MLEYYKDGETVRLDALYGKGVVGRRVILDNVCFSKDSISPLAKYPSRTVFAIIEKTFVDNWNYSYVLMDNSGERFVLSRDGGDTAYIYDLEAWALFLYESEKEHRARKDKKIAHLESQVALLKDILIKQGVRVITQEQSKTLGLS
ncbi:MAG: hypothetical protein NTZ13_00345 [Candidatus Parcubacteria bacterium]|nr:hypothetical protein [Candidatus Parcubacteria bacterium]